MLIDRYFHELFPSLIDRPIRVPSRLVRYGIIHTDTLKNAIDGFEPRFDPAMKAQAEKMVEKLQAFIALMEEYEENTIDGPTEEDDSKAEAKAKAKPKAKRKKSV